MVRQAHHEGRPERRAVTRFGAIVARDLRLVWRRPGDAAVVLAFFVLAASLFPLGVGPALETLARIAPGVLWVAALLAALLSLERLFADDFADGSLEHLALAPLPLELVVLAKCVAHWLVTGLPLDFVTCAGAAVRPRWTIHCRADRVAARWARRA